jgi:hypothetical protein
VVPAKKKESEQTALLLREILLELRRLNANLEKRGTMPPAMQDADESDDGEEDDDSEELDHFE